MKWFAAALLLANLLTAGEPLKLSVSQIKSSSLNEGEITMISEKLTLELLSAGQFTILDRANIDALMAEQMLQESEMMENEGTPPVQPASADLLLSGSIEKMDKLYVVSLKLVDVKTGMIKKALSENYKSSFKDFLSRDVKIIAAEISKTPPTPPAPAQEAP